MNNNSNLFCPKCNSCRLSSEFRLLTGKSARGKKTDEGQRFSWCLSCERQYARERRRKIKEQDYLHYIYTYKIRIRQKEKWGNLIEFDKLNDLWEQQSGLCYWTKIPMIRYLDRRDALSVSVDRLNIAAGYEESNVILCCQFVNVARQVQSPDEFAIYLKNFIDFITPLVCTEKNGNP